MRVLLIRPPQEGFFHTNERHYPIGLLYIAEACRRKDYDVEILDSLIYKNTPYVIEKKEMSKIQHDKLNKNPIFSEYIHYGSRIDDICNYISIYNPDCIGISIMFSCFYDTAYMLARRIKNMFPYITIIAGGAHVTSMYEHVMDNEAIDYAIRYEGEIAFPLLLDRIKENCSPNDIPGIVYRSSELHNKTTISGRGIFCNEEVMRIKDLDDIKPAFDLINIFDYESVSIITSRGCPYDCNFCSVNLSMGKEFRDRSKMNVVDEIENYYKMGVNRFNIEDDNFSLDINRAKDIFSEILNRKIKAEFYLPNGIISCNIDKSTIKLFELAGVKKLFFGLETISQRRLFEIGKNHTSLNEAMRAVRLANDSGIEAGVSLIIGFPDQTFSEIINEISLLISLKIPILAINPLYPIPHTEMYDNCLEKGILSGNEDYIELGGDNFPICNKDFTKEDLYYIWVAVRGLNALNIHERYELSAKKCLRFISQHYLGKISFSEKETTLFISIYKLRNEIISAKYKICVDMIISAIYLLTGIYYSCDYYIDSSYLVIKLEQSNELPPRAIGELHTNIISFDSHKMDISKIDAYMINGG